MKVINIGNTQTEVIINHSKKDCIYFIENFLDIKLSQYQKEILRHVKSKHKLKRGIVNGNSNVII